MLNNRDFQRAVLTNLVKEYPDVVPYQNIDAVFEAIYPPGYFEDEKELFFNRHPMDGDLYYLEEHGLISLVHLDTGVEIYTVKATAKGVDFISNDGGLGAILNAVTVKFDADNLRSLVEQGLLKAEMPEEKRSAVRKALHALPGAALQTVVTTLVQQAMTDPMKAMKAVAGILGVSL